MVYIFDAEIERSGLLAENFGYLLQNRYRCWFLHLYLVCTHFPGINCNNVPVFDVVLSQVGLGGQ